MPQCCIGDACRHADVPLGTTHKCLRCPEPDNIAHAPCLVQVVLKGDVLVRPPNSDNTRNADTREFDIRLLPQWGVDHVDRDMFGICKKCWETLARPPWLLDGTDVPMDVVIALFNEWLTGSTSNRDAIGQLELLFDGDIARARTYFREEFEANATTQARGDRDDRVARAGAFARPLPGSLTFASAFETANARDRGRDPLIPARSDLGASVPASGGGRGAGGRGPGGRGAGGRGRGRGGRGYVPPQLADARAEMTLEGIKQARRAKKTFDKRNGENVSFILWLFDNKPEFLKPEFLEELQRTDSEIDYSILARKRYKGKKNIDERKAEFRRSTLADACKSVLGDLSQAPTMPTVDLDAVANNVEGSFFDYLCNRKKQDGGLMMASCYSGYRSALTFQFKRDGRSIPEELKEEISDLMKGVKRIANKARQAGEGTMHEGSRALTWPLYLFFQKKFLELGTKEGIMAAAYSAVTMNLACRGDSTGMICTHHLQWDGDSTAISFSHSKEEQLGDDPTKRLPRHCFCNPILQGADFASNLFNYLAMFPHVLGRPNGLLFPFQDAAGMFTEQIKKVCSLYKEEIERDFGFNVKDIGIHSWRKCAHTKMNCGSTVGPTNAATCIRGGHSIGSTRSVYVVQEQASDEICGRILAGLPEHSAEFAASYADFIPIDTAQSLTAEGVSVVDYETRKAQVDAQVKEGLNQIFGVERLDAFPSINRFLQIGLASHLMHREAIDACLPSNSNFRHTTLFTSSAFLSMKEHVRIAMPWDDHYKYFAPATGIPPHVIGFQYFEEVKKLLSQLPGQFEQILDNRQFNGQISLDQMRNLIEQGPTMRAMATDIASMRRMLHNLNGREEGLGPNISFDDNRARTYSHSDGGTRRVPEGWTFPQLTLLQAYAYWHCGNDQSENPIAPMKVFCAEDMKHVKRGRLNLTDMRHLAGLIDDKARAKGHEIRDVMARTEVNSCFFAGLDGIDIDLRTPTGRVRDVSALTWSSVLRMMNNKKRRRIDAFPADEADAAET